MAVIDARQAARSAATCHDVPGPLRRLCGEARSPFIVHGHRLTSLCRRCRKQPNPFIVLKIHKLHRLRLAEVPVYLRNNEAGGIA